MARIRPWLAVALCLAWAGCAEPDPTDGTMPPSSRTSVPGSDLAGSPNGTSDVLVLEDGMTPTLRMVRVGTFGYQDASTGGNCVAFERGEVRRVRSAVFEASWVATLETHRELRLVGGDVGREATVTGPSPLRLELADVDVERAFRLYIRAPSEPAIVLDQPVELRWRIEYEGRADPERPMNASCG